MTTEEKLNGLRRAVHTALLAQAATFIAIKRENEDEIAQHTDTLKQMTDMVVWMVLSLVESGAKLSAVSAAVSGGRIDYEQEIAMMLEAN